MPHFSSQVVRVLSCAATIVVLATVSGCATPVSAGDLPAWQATTLPSDPGVVAADAGRILDRQPVVQRKDVESGSYILTLVCEGVGKAFLTVRSGGNDLVELGAACNGAKETTKVSVTDPGTLELRTSSVDAPLLYAYQLAAPR